MLNPPYHLQLIIMSKPHGPGHPDPLISSMFVSQRSGLLLKQLMQLESGVRVRLTDVRPGHFYTCQEGGSQETF